MTGPKQHYIPQFLLRGFGIQKGRKVRVNVYPKSREPFPVATDGIGAQRFFYSDQEEGRRGNSLDGRITKYENKLKVIYASLCSAPFGEDHPRDDVAELCTHLCIRQAHMRSSFASVASAVVTGCGDIFLDKEKSREIMGLNGSSPSGVMLEKIRSMYKEGEVLFQAAGLSLSEFEKIAFDKMKEGYDSYFPDQAAAIREAVVTLSGMADEAARNGHNKALDQEFAPELRVEELKKFRWLNRPAPECGAVLPDCIAICRTNDGQYVPLVFADRGTIDVIYMPLRHDVIMVGSLNGDDVPDDINDLFASCSRDFFVSYGRSRVFDLVAKGMGHRLDALLSTLASDALKDIDLNAPIGSQ